MTAAEVVAAVLDEYRRGGRGTRSFRYSFSGAGEPCLRALVYDATDAEDGKPPAESAGEVSWSLSAVCGTAVGEALERAGLLCGWRSQVPAEFDTGAVAVRGSADLVTPDLVIDWKVVGEKKWDRVRSKPDEKHVLQVNGYAVALDKPRWALAYIRGVTIFDGSTTPEIRIHEGAASVELARDLCGVWEQVDAHVAVRTLPERVFNASPSTFPCSFCRHLARCAPASTQEESNA